MPSTSRQQASPPRLLPFPLHLVATLVGGVVARKEQDACREILLHGGHIEVLRPPGVPEGGKDLVLQRGHLPLHLLQAAQGLVPLEHLSLPLLSKALQLLLQGRYHVQLALSAVLGRQLVLAPLADVLDQLYLLRRQVS